jgi:hypothetical protein
VHALSQHTPSMQKPLVHWFAPVHAWPLALLGTHDVPEQYALEAQSPSVVQVVLQAVAPHAYRPQELVPPATQLPLPSQVEALVCVVPLQLSGAHSVPDAYKAHAPAPLQAPEVPQEAAP